MSTNATRHRAARTATPNDNYILEQWRTWNAARIEISAARKKLARLEAKLPEDLKACAVKVGTSKERWIRLCRTNAEIDEASKYQLATANGLVPMEKSARAYKAELRDIQKRRRQAVEKLGISKLQTEVLPPLLKTWSEAENRLEKVRNPSPLASAIRLHMQMANVSEIFDAYQMRFSAAILRDLLPALPAEMTAVIAPLVRRVQRLAGS
ncbi:hypothetical protein [Dongia sp.]|uniref:hypothetical protein n=1 Tax=Dongia sp. TaxID=1977262 RepID=UPI0035B0E849